MMWLDLNLRIYSIKTMNFIDFITIFMAEYGDGFVPKIDLIIESG